MSYTNLSDDDLENYDNLFQKMFFRFLIIHNYFFPDCRGEVQELSIVED